MSPIVSKKGQGFQLDKCPACGSELLSNGACPNGCAQQQPDGGQEKGGDGEQS